MRIKVLKPLNGQVGILFMLILSQPKLPVASDGLLWLGLHDHALVLDVLEQAVFDGTPVIPELLHLLRFLDKIPRWVGWVPDGEWYPALVVHDILCHINHLRRSLEWSGWHSVINSLDVVHFLLQDLTLLLLHHFVHGNLHDLEHLAARLFLDLHFFIFFLGEVKVTASTAITFFLVLKFLVELDSSTLTILNYFV